MMDMSFGAAIGFVAVSLGSLCAVGIITNLRVKWAAHCAQYRAAANEREARDE